MTSIFKLGENKIAELVIDSLNKRMKEIEKTHLGLVPQVEAFENGWGGIDVRISARSATLITTRHVVIKEYQQQSFFRVHYKDHMQKVDEGHTYVEVANAEIAISCASAGILEYLLEGALPEQSVVLEGAYQDWLNGFYPLPEGDFRHREHKRHSKDSRFAPPKMKLSNAVLPPPPEKVGGLSPTFRF